MTSSKKKRGKQRKAAKNREGDTIYNHNTSGDLIPVEINFVPVPGRDNT